MPTTSSKLAWIHIALSKPEIKGRQGIIISWKYFEDFKIIFEDINRFNRNPVVFDKLVTVRISNSFNRLLQHWKALGHTKAIKNNLKNKTLDHFHGLMYS